MLDNNELSNLDNWHTIDVYTPDAYNIPVNCISCSHTHLKFPCLLISNDTGPFNYNNFFVMDLIDFDILFGNCTLDNNQMSDIMNWVKMYQYNILLDWIRKLTGNFDW